MGVWVQPNLVKRNDGKIEKIQSKQAPEIQPIYFLNDLIFLDDYKNSLLDICGGEVNLDFFIKHNSSDYGNTEFSEVSFTPEKVLDTVNKIENGFNKNEEKFQFKTQYEGVFDDQNKQLRMVFTEYQEGKFLTKKKFYEWGTISSNDKDVILQVYDSKKETWKERISLTQNNPKLYYCEVDKENNKIRKGLIDWSIKSSSFFEKIKPELENIRKIAEFAQTQNLELQITHS